MTKPIFIISLPRSGSTLLQKILAANKDVASTAEAWIMLPFWGMRGPERGRAVYSHHTAANAINDFISNSSLGEETFRTAVTTYANCMYEGAATGRSYFLDKTPRYYLMLPMLAEFFPDARIIQLTRNPIAVLASICQTFYKGRFMWPDYWIDWDEGHACMAEAIKTPDANQRIVRYEDLVMNPAEQICDLCDWLEITYSDDMVYNYNINALFGRMGDLKCGRLRTGVITSTLNKWQQYLCTPFRHTIVRKMLDRISNARLNAFGYPRAMLDSMLEEAPVKNDFDLNGRIEFMLGHLAYILDYRYWQARYRSARDRSKYTFGHFRKS